MTQSAMEYESTSLTVHRAANLASELRTAIGKAVIGQTELVDQLLIALFAAGHVLIEGVPGLGKTLLARALAKTISGQFSRVQFTPDLMPADVTGHMLYDLKNERFTLHRGPIFAHFLLADEINRAPAKTQAALLEVMQERQVTIEGQALVVPQPFMVFATQNPFDHEGTYPLPEAQVDRFLLKLCVSYPEAEEEHMLLKAVTEGHIADVLDVSTVTEVTTPESILAMQRLCAQVRVDDAVSRYALAIVRATRSWPGLRMGAGPRGAIALVRAARAYALLLGREYLIPSDVKAVVLPVLRHRIALSPELELEGIDADTILQQILAQTPAPRE